MRDFKNRCHLQRQKEEKKNAKRRREQNEFIRKVQS